MDANEPPDATMPPTDDGTAAARRGSRRCRVDGPDGRFMVDIVINEVNEASADDAEREAVDIVINEASADDAGRGAEEVETARAAEKTTPAAEETGPETEARPDAAAEEREPAAAADPDNGGGGPDAGVAAPRAEVPESQTAESRRDAADEFEPTEEREPAEPDCGLAAPRIAWDGVCRLVAGVGGDSVGSVFRPPRPPPPVDAAHRYYVESDVVGGAGGSPDGRAARARLPVSYVSGGRPLPGPPRGRRRGQSRGRDRSRGRGGSRSRSRSRRTDGTGDTPAHRSSSSSRPRGETSRRPVILYCHGHDDDLGTVLNRLRILSKGLGCDVVGFDYAGYGTSHVRPRVVWRDEADVPGGLDESRHPPSPPSPSRRAELVPSEEQVHADVRAVYDHLTGPCGVDPRDLVLYGKSLGAAAACRLVRDLVRSSALDEVGGKGGGSDGARCRPPAAGLVLHSAPRDGSVLSRDSAGPVAALRDAVAAAFRGSGERETAPFPTEEYVREIAELGGNVPTYFVHGAQDRTVPLEHGMGLYQTVRAAEGKERGFPPFWAEDCGHSDVETKLSTAYVKRLEQFLRHCHCERVKRESKALVAAARSKSIGDDGGSLMGDLQRAFESMTGASQGGRPRSRSRGRGRGGRGPSSQGRSSSRSGRASSSPGRPRSSSRRRRARDRRERARRKSGTLVMRGEVDGAEVVPSARRAGKNSAAVGVAGTSPAGAGRAAESREPGHSR